MQLKRDARGQLSHGSVAKWTDEPSAQSMKLITLSIFHGLK